MPDDKSDVRLYWPSVSGYEADGSLSFRLTGSEGDCWFTGHFPVAPDDPEFRFWAWVHDHHRTLPPFFDEYYIPSLRASFLAGNNTFAIPEDSLYVITADWSGPSLMVQTAMRQELDSRSLPLPVRYMSTDSTDIDLRFPQLRPFLHGWGEIFGFRGGRCDLFFAPGPHPSTISQTIDYLFKHYED